MTFDIGQSVTVMTNQMDTPKIMGPWDYQRFYHTSSEGLVWLDRKGNPIPLSHMLDMHIESIDPSELWNSIEMWSKFHKQNLTALGNGPTNSTTIDANAPILMTPTSPIMEHYVEVSHPEASSMATCQKTPTYNWGWCNLHWAWSHLYLHQVNYLLLGITTQ